MKTGRKKNGARNDVSTSRCQKFKAKVTMCWPHGAGQSTRQIPRVTRGKTWTTTTERATVWVTIRVTGINEVNGQQAEVTGNSDIHIRCWIQVHFVYLWLRLILFVIMWCFIFIIVGLVICNRRRRKPD